MKTQTITITIKGMSEDDRDDAFDEAVKRIKDGNTSGKDENESGGFHFSVEDVDQSDDDGEEMGRCIRCKAFALGTSKFGGHVCCGCNDDDGDLTGEEDEE